MPFTVAHVAAALPFRRWNLVWSAFVIGSVAPDFPYVIGSVKYRALGHHFPGVVLFTLPISFVVLWFFHFAIKKPVAGLLPIGVQQRLNGQLDDFKFGGATRMLAITFSIILGIATHLVWDAFTHTYTWPWRHLPFLQSWVDLPVAGLAPTYMVLQYASTFLGLLALGIWLVLWYRKTEPDRGMALQASVKSRVSLAVIMFAIALGIGLMRAWLLIGEMPRTIHNWDWFMLNFGVTAIAAGFWELIVYCLLATSRQYAESRLRSV
jgi:Domain of unknown function (DUF4184)